MIYTYKRRLAYKGAAQGSMKLIWLKSAVIVVLTRSRSERSQEKMKWSGELTGSM